MWYIYHDGNLVGYKQSEDSARAHGNTLQKKFRPTVSHVVELKTQRELELYTDAIRMMRILEHLNETREWRLFNYSTNK